MAESEHLEELALEGSGRVRLVESLAELDALVEELLGAGSEIASVRRSMGGLAPEQRPIVGAALNKSTLMIQSAVDDRRRLFDLRAEEEQLLAETIDVTLDTLTLPNGSIHLVQQTIDEIVDIFVGLGYQMATGPEAELSWYNFDALNTPATHPSRLETDTMYLDYGADADGLLMRTHTSPMQVRWMEQHEPPVYIVVPGKAYRLDAIDASHLPVFHQIEGLAVDEGITFSDLKGTLDHVAREFFGTDTVTRLRPHFFPFTEPSAELDVFCFVCRGENPSCRVCKGSGWLEMLGCGMVDPNVFEAVGYDREKVTGFAFGMGVERPAMVRYGIDDIRHFVDNDIRFLKQFP